MLKLLAVFGAAYLGVRIARALGFGIGASARVDGPSEKAVDKSRAVDAEFEDI